MSRIMIVDDSTHARLRLKKILADAGHDIVGEAATGSDAVVKYSLIKPDIVTMDITMPDMNGIDALRGIMEQDENAKIVMITALSQSNKVLEALKAGAKNYITKPFEDQKVLSVINGMA